MKSIHKYFLTVLLLFGAIFSQDTDPPYYIDDPEFGPSIEIHTPSEVIGENSIVDFQLYWQVTPWVQDGNALLDDGSGIENTGFRFISSSGEINDVLIRGYIDWDFGSFSGETSGSWEDYINTAYVECVDDESWHEEPVCYTGIFNLTIPTSELELGTYDLQFIAIDYAGNELVISEDEFSYLNVDNGSTITCSSSDDEIYINEYGDVPILNWGWGLFQLVLIDSDALSGLEEGTDIYVLDELGIPDEGCDGDFGPIIVGYNTYQGEIETPYELVCGEGIDLCGFNGPRLPGYVEGNTMKIYAADENHNTFEGEVTEYSIGEGMFGEPLTYITGINFERSEVQLSNIHSLETNNSRNQYRYNIYRNEELFLSEFQSVYYIDEDINDNTDYCYEVYLIDNYDDSEFLATDEVCFYSETDSLLGDVNQDGLVNVLDVVSIVGYILGSQELNETELYLSDYNEDGSVNVLDVVAIVGIILGN